MYVCICLGVTDRQIIQSIDDGQNTVEGIRSTTGAGGCCGACVSVVEDILKEKLVSVQNTQPPPLLSVALLSEKRTDMLEESVSISHAGKQELGKRDSDKHVSDKKTPAAPYSFALAK